MRPHLDPYRPHLDLPGSLQCVAKLEKAENECKSLMDKYTIVENDKKSLKLVRGGEDEDGRN